MSLEVMYQNRRQQIIARAMESLTRPNASPEHIVADGKLQVQVAQNDLALLTENGMDPALVVDVEESLGAYTWLVTLLETKLSDQNINLDRYKKMIVQGYELRRNLFKFGKFGCKKNKKSAAKKELMEIIDGFGDLDMIFDLIKLFQLFSNNPDMIEGLPTFNHAWIDQAEALHNNLYELRNEVKDPSVKSEVKALEREVKQAYDLYHEKVNELREWGEFVFEGEERAEKYKAEYYAVRYEKAQETKRRNAGNANSDQ